MKLSKAIMVFLFLFSLNARAESNTEVLTKIWSIGSHQACTPEMRAQFSSENFASLNSQIKNPNDRHELSDVLNPWLKHLGWSHTEFMSDQSDGYFLFKSYLATFNPKPPEFPKIINPGVQLGHDSKGFYIREVLNGFSAEQAGVKKGDRIVSWRSSTFSGIWGTKPSRGKLVVIRGSKTKILRLKTEALDWNETFLDATKNSVKIFNIDNKKIGYIHLWTGLHQKSAATLQTLVSQLKPNVDKMILDLRGGYGGAWYDHLDPFFADTSSYYESESLDGDNVRKAEKAEFKINPDPYLGPLVVIINNGSRSGKEALAYQFKKSQRATLVGETTAGYFSGGGFFFADQPTDYVLYLCVSRITLDNTQIESVGVAPDFEIPYRTGGEYGDSQLEKALRLSL